MLSSGSGSAPAASIHWKACALTERICCPGQATVRPGYNKLLQQHPSHLPSSAPQWAWCATKQVWLTHRGSQTQCTSLSMCCTVKADLFEQPYPLHLLLIHVQCSLSEDSLMLQTWLLSELETPFMLSRSLSVSSLLSASLSESSKCDCRTRSRSSSSMSK